MKVAFLQYLLENTSWTQQKEFLVYEAITIGFVLRVTDFLLTPQCVLTLHNSQVYNSKNQHVFIS